MSVTGLVALLFVFVFFGLVIVFAAAGRNKPGVNLRPIPAFERLKQVVDQSVEAGSRLHLSIGRGNITGPEFGAALVGLNVLERILRSASSGDKPPVTTSGQPMLTILAQDVLTGTYRDMGIVEHRDTTANRLTGFTPFSFAAGTLPIIYGENVSANVLLGSFSSEAGLIADGGENSTSMTVGGTDDLSGQAVLYATAAEPLIGEELYASGAYIGEELIHAASLHAQDVIRWLLIIAIIVGAVLSVFGLDEVVKSVLDGLL